MYQQTRASNLIYFPLPPSSSRSPTENDPGQALNLAQSGDFSAAKIQSVEIDMDMSALRISVEQPLSPTVGYHACSKDSPPSPSNLHDQPFVGPPASSKDSFQPSSELLDKPFVGPRELKAHYAHQRLACPAYAEGLAIPQPPGFTRMTKTKCIKYPISYRLKSNPEQARKHLPREPFGSVPLYPGLSAYDTNRPSNDRRGLVYPSIGSQTERGKQANQSSLSVSDVGSTQPSIAQREQFVYYNHAKPLDDLGHPRSVQPAAAPGELASASSSATSNASCDASMTNVSPKSAATTVDGSVNSSADWAFESLKTDPENQPGEASPYAGSQISRKGSVLNRPRPLRRGRGASFCAPDIEFDRLTAVKGLKPAKSFDRGRRKWLAPPLPVPALPASKLDVGNTQHEPTSALEASWAHPPAPKLFNLMASRAQSPGSTLTADRQNDSVTDVPCASQPSPLDAELIIKSRPSLLAPLAPLEQTHLCLDLKFDGPESPLDHVQYRKAIESLLIKMENQSSRRDKSASKEDRSAGKPGGKVQKKISKLNLNAKAFLGARKTEQPQQQPGEHQKSGKNWFLHNLFG